MYNEATSKAKLEYEANKAAYEQQKLAQIKDAEVDQVSTSLHYICSRIDPQLRFSLLYRPRQKPRHRKKRRTQT